MRRSRGPARSSSGPRSRSSARSPGASSRSCAASRSPPLADLRRARLVRDRLPLLRALHRASRCWGSTTTRATPAERLDNEIDFQPTDRRVLFGHHFAAIAGAGPLVGPVLAAQMGYLPGTIWIIVGVIFAGAVQDMVILFFSMRRDGKSLGQMARDEIGPVGGVAALIAVFSIMIILLAVLALVVVNALARVAVGDVLDRDDDPDRVLHGLLHARAAARAGARDDARSASRCCCWRSSPAAGCRSPTARWPTSSRSRPRR